MKLSQCLPFCGEYALLILTYIWYIGYMPSGHSAYEAYQVVSLTVLVKALEGKMVLLLHKHDGGVLY